MGDVNPFAAARSNFYVDPQWTSAVDRLARSAPSERLKATLATIRELPSGFWIDSKAKVHGTGPQAAQGVLAAASKHSPPSLCTFVLHVLPNRGCHDGAGSEICCAYNSDGSCNYEAEGSCADGLAEYARDVVDALASVLAMHPSVPVVIMLEPDALANLATDPDGARCGSASTSTAYRQGIRYAVERLASARASLYLDAAHGAWLGWPEQATAYARLVASLGVVSRVRGFVTNVGGYQPLGTACPASEVERSLLQMRHGGDGGGDIGGGGGGGGDDEGGDIPALRAYCLGSGGGGGGGGSRPPPCCRDACGMLARGASGQNEHNFVQLMAAALRAALPTSAQQQLQQQHGEWPRFVIDTARSGIDDMRADCASTCNLRGAGLGLWPTAQTALPHVVDAYWWVRPPGLSDGCGGGRCCAHADDGCTAADALGSRAGEPCAPRAGHRYDEHLLGLAARAHLQAQDETVLGLRGDAATAGGPPKAELPTPPAPPPAPPPPFCLACGSAAGNGLAAAAVLVVGLLLVASVACGRLRAATLKRWRSGGTMGVGAASRKPAKWRASSTHEAGLLAQPAEPGAAAEEDGSGDEDEENDDDDDEDEEEEEAGATRGQEEARRARQRRELGVAAMDM